MSTKKAFGKLAEFIHGKSILILIIVFLVCITSFQGMKLIERETGIDTFVKKGTPLYHNFETYNDHFSRNTIAILITADDVTEYHTVKAIEKLGKELEEESGVAKVLSLATSLGDHIPHNQAKINQIIEKLPEEIRKDLVPDQQHTVISVQLIPGMEMKETEDVYHRVKRVVNIADIPPGIDLAVTGEPAFGAQMKEKMSKNLNFMMAMAGIFMILILYFIFSHVRWRLLPLISVIIGILWTFGSMGLLGIPLAIATMAVFPILIGVGIDYAIQFHNRLDEGIKSGLSAKGALIQATKHIGVAVGIVVIVSVLAYSSLFTSPVPMINDFGSISMIGTILCYLSAIFFALPVLYILYKRKGARRERAKPEKNENILGKILGNIAAGSAKRPIIVLLIVTLITISGFVCDQKVGISLKEEDYVPEEMPAVVELEKWTRVTERPEHLQILVSSDHVTDPANLRWMDEFGKHEEEWRKKVIGHSSIASLLPTKKIPSTSAEVSAILDEINEKNRYVSGKNLALLDLELEPGLNILEARGIIKDVRGDLKTHSPPAGSHASLTGSLVLMNSIFHAMTSGRIMMYMLSAALIFVGLLLIYRKLFRAIIPVIPVIMVVGWLGLVMYGADIKYNPLTATLGALIIGIGSEYAILMMERYLEERTRRDPIDAIRKSASTIGLAIIPSGTTTMGGFGALILSSFPIVRNFGIVTTIIFISLLIISFVVLPALLVLMDRKL